MYMGIDCNSNNADNVRMRDPYRYSSRTLDSGASTNFVLGSDASSSCSHSSTLDGSIPPLPLPSPSLVVAMSKLSGMRRATFAVANADNNEHPP
jgi:hypothetical protein